MATDGARAAVSSLIGLEPDELALAVQRAGESEAAARMRARQLRNWLYVRGAADFERMANLATRAGVI